MKDLLKKLVDFAGYIGERLKYGEESDASASVGLVASTVVKAKSGRFVTLNTAGNAYLTSAADTTIYGSLEGGYDVTASATCRSTMLGKRPIYI